MEAREAQLAAALMIIGAEAARIFQIYQRHRSRNYLCRPQLPPNPRVGTAWQALFRSRNDRAFITTMGFDAQCPVAQGQIPSHHRRCRRLLVVFDGGVGIIDVAGADLLID